MRSEFINDLKRRAAGRARASAENTENTLWTRSLFDNYIPSLAWGILALAISLTIAAWYMSSQSVQRAAKFRFEHYAFDMGLRIEDRVRNQTVALLGGVGFLEASDNVSLQEWRDFIKTLNTTDYQQGMQGYGYIELVSHEGRRAFVERMRANGLAGYGIKPGGIRPRYAPVVYYERLDSNYSVPLGFDKFLDTARFEAMEHAAYTGRPSMSGLAHPSSTDQVNASAGIFIFAPVYRRDERIGRDGVTRTDVKGYVFSPLRLEELMLDLLLRTESTVSVRIYDGVGPATKQLIFDSAVFSENTANQIVSGLRLDKTIVVNGRPWTLEFRAKEGFIPSSEAREPQLVAAFGCLINVLLFLTILSLNGQRFRAQRMARAMTDELRQAKERAEGLSAIETDLRRETQRSNSELRAANKGLLRFTSVIAHDLRAPLKRIEAFINILNEDYSERLEKDGQDLLERIARGSERMRSMLDSMHNYSKCSNVAIDGKTAHIRTVVSNAAETLSADLQHVQLHLNIDETCVVRGDAMLLEHVIQNLIANSLKFCSDKSPEITIEAGVQDDGKVLVEVIDNGIGVEPEHSRSVFEMFTRLHNEDEYEGTGIGLAICKRVISDHGGDIFIDTNWSCGTRVVIILQPALGSEVAHFDSVAA